MMALIICAKYANIPCYHVPSLRYNCIVGQLMLAIRLPETIEKRLDRLAKRVELAPGGVGEGPY